MTLSPCRDVSDLFRAGSTFQEYWSLGMEAIANRSKRILERAEDAKSPQRILLPSLLKSRNKLRAKYRELRADCKRWRNQVAAVGRSRSSWRQRAETGEATAQRQQAERVALESQLQQIREQSQEREAELSALRAQLAASEEAEKKGR
jgi:chromosome segregation ATPase